LRTEILVKAKNGSVGDILHQHISIDVFGDGVPIHAILAGSAGLGGRVLYVFFEDGLTSAMSISIRVLHLIDKLGTRQALDVGKLVDCLLILLKFRAEQGVLHRCIRTFDDLTILELLIRVKDDGGQNVPRFTIVGERDSDFVFPAFQNFGGNDNGC
jgi:hypothetical protein